MKIRYTGLLKDKSPSDTISQPLPPLARTDKPAWDSVFERFEEMAKPHPAPSRTGQKKSSK